MNGGTVALDPGTYCGGLRITNGAVVTAHRGVYILSGGPFLLDGAQIEGDEVTFVLADSDATLNWTNATVRLIAPKADDYAGIVLLGVRQSTTHNFAGSTIDLHGVVYLPNGKLTWTNSGTPSITAKWTAWIIDGVTWQGDGVIKINFNLNDSGVPYPTSLNIIPRPGSPRLIK